MTYTGLEYKTLGYEIHHNILSDDACKILAAELQMCKDDYYAYHNKNSSEFLPDGQVENAFAWYGGWGCESLLLLLQPAMEKIAGKKLFPSHTYSRIYYNGAKLDHHTDRAWMKHSMTITLEMDETVWPIYITGRDGVTKEAVLPTGSALVYSGDKLDHWRLPYTGKKQVQTFLHWVDDERIQYDGRPRLGSQFIGSGRRTELAKQTGY